MSTDRSTAGGEGRVRARGPASFPYPVGIRELQEGPYDVRFACEERDLRAVQKLRFDVFNVELEEGLASSAETGLDQDRFDRQCHHLMLVDRRTGEVVGTYRLTTSDMALAGEGFYCSSEFDLSHLPEYMLADSVELGRACILREHRHGTALFALWRGLAAYLVWCGKRYFFGCCSLSTLDPRAGWAMERKLEAGGYIHPEFSLFPLATHALGPRPPATVALPEIETPKLFHTYLRYGAKSCGPPALDADFGTIDFFVVFDLETIPRRLRGLFFHGLEGPAAGA